ncbi:MAG TPA: M1 family metallopeptidase [Acidimicrobiales bacterium]|nr:M1 family metallopeptidase [Acidimicrobiales bacterium]
MATRSHRLPRSAEPQRYDLTLTPNLGDATFTGEVHVRLVVHEAVDEIVLNAAELEILTAELVSDDGTMLEGTATHDEELQQARVALSGTASPGHWNLNLTFTGILNDKLRGFYRSTYTDDDGTEHVIATTQFESTDARRAFPCWDEPDFKAVFAVRLIVDTDLTAISNGATVEDVDLGNGKRQVTFAETIRMSTYLVAFVVGPFELTPPVDVDGVPLRVAAVRGKAHLSAWALETGAHSLRFFRDYFGLPYPGDKLDLIAIPDFAFGAMENLGAVTFRETALLADPDLASRADLEMIADVVAHEIAHMWFGDLVTMKWWNGIWLNEAFATFMELLCVDAFRPDWERWVTFGISRSGAMTVDGLRSTRPIEIAVELPEEAEAMFDVLTYQKGAAVLRMLEQYLGAEPFRQGIVHYLTKHSYGNAETTDLWDALEESTGEPVRGLMDTWIFQGGYPIVTVDAAPDSTSLTLHQRQFRYVDDGDAAARWQVPVLVRAGDARQRALVADAEGTIDLGAKTDGAVVNDGGWGFYRVQYPVEQLPALVRGGLSRLERFNLASDVWASVLAGRAPLTDFVELVGLLKDDDDPNVWSALLGPLALLDRVVPDDGRDAVRRFVRDVARPVFDRLGWEPAAGEAERTARLRATIVAALGVTGADPDVQREAAARHARYVDDRTSLDPDLVAPVISVVAQGGGEAEYTTFLSGYRAPATPQEQIRYLYALAEFPSRALVQRTLDLAVTEVRTQNAPFVINVALGNRLAADLVWDFVTSRWSELEERFPHKMMDRMVSSAMFLTKQAEQVHAFFAEHPIPTGQKQLDQTLERLDIHAAFETREADRIAEALS